MTYQEVQQPVDGADPAAVFACANALWDACHEAASNDRKPNLSEAYQGMDELMRQVMRIGEKFEGWACDHICFDALEGVWPYLLEDRFGKACLEIVGPSELAQFAETDCLRIALRMRLPVLLAPDLPVPVDLHVANPIADSEFREFRIQTVRDRTEESDETEPFTVDDDPFDPEFSTPYFGLYGLGQSGLLEHIANRRTYAEAVNLLRKLAPGITLPESPTSPLA